MRRFELTEGSANKFWEIKVADQTLTVHFGRIGTQGQSKAKSFADDRAASTERDKLIREKTGKGYVEVGEVDEVGTADADAGKAATAQAAPAPAATTPPTAAPTPAPGSAAIQDAPSRPATASAPGAIDPASLPWPQAKAKPSTAALDKLPVVRGLHVPPFESPQDIFSSPPRLRRAACDDDQLAAMAQLCGDDWEPWGVISTESLSLPSLSAASRDGWLQACAQCLSNRHIDDWIVHAGLCLRGPAFMVDMLLSLAPATTNHWLWHRHLHTLRHALAAAPDEQLAAAEAQAERLRHTSPTSLLMACHLFPHRSDWVADALAAADTLAAPAQNQHGYNLLNDSPLTPAQVEQLISLTNWYRPNLTLLAHVHGPALLPVLSALLDKASPHEVVTYLDVLMSLPCPAQIPTLIAQFERHPQARTRLDKLGERYPAATLYTAIGQALGTRSRLLQGWALRLGSHHPDALAQALAALAPDEAAQWQKTVASLAQPEAPANALPALLHTPPWLSSVKPAPLPTLDMPALPIAPRIDALPDYYHDGNWYKQHLLKDARRLGSLELAVLAELHIPPERGQTILDGRPIQADDVQPTSYWRSMRSLQSLPDPLMLRVWNEYPAAHWPDEDESARILPLLGRFGTAALPGLRHYAGQYPERGLAIGAQIDDAALADLALRGQRRGKKWRAAALAWMQRYPRSTAIRALHHAFGPDAALREAGATALRWLLHEGGEAHAALIDTVATEYGGAMPAAWQALKAQDPLAVLPAKLPKLPSFFAPATFARPLLKNGQGALPLDAVQHLSTMLAISRPEAPYAGIEIVREACTADSLADFAWDLFEAWETAGAPAAHNWAFQALRWLGNDETVRRLAPRVRAWPGESAAARALAGLDILAAIGSDLALMQVNAIGDKSKFNKLRKHAREKIAAIAEARELTPDELADRLVPELGLDERGAELLDFGPRQFRVGFDETLSPQVRDASGARLKTLPRPNKADNAELARAASARFKQLKKDAEAIASAQIARLERAMTQQRRWPAFDFERFFVQHPVMRFLATRLIWGVYAGPAPGDAFITAFRLAEDWTLADEHDESYTLPATATVGIAHVLDLPPATLAAFAQLLADYEVAQPFAQLGRSTEALTEAELQAGSVTRFAQRPVRAGSIMGLTHRGWERGPAYESGMVTHFSKSVPGSAHLIVAQIEPGLYLNHMQAEPKQTVTALSLRANVDGPARPLAELDRVAASEMLRDIHLMAPWSE